MITPPLPSAAVRSSALLSVRALRLAGVMVLAVAPVPAQGPASRKTHPAPQRLPEVVITETRAKGDSAFSEVPLDNPAARSVIGPDQVREAAALNTQEILRRSPNLFVTEETGSDSLPNVAVRGLTGNEGAYRSINLSMLVDGIPLAPAPYGHPGSSLFPFTMERLHAVDVQRGGTSVRYGPNNVSGVINFLTRPIPDRPTVEGRVRYDSFHNVSLYGAAGETAGPFGVLFEAVYKDGESFRANGDYTLQNYALKARYDLAEDLRLFAQVEAFDDETRLSDGLTLAAFREDPRQTLSPQNRFDGHQNRANAKLAWRVDRDTVFEVVTYVYDGERTFYLGNPSYYGNNPPNYLQATPRPMRVWAVQPQVSHTFGFGDCVAELNAGVRYLQEDIVRSVERLFPNGAFTRTSQDQFDYDTGSAFVEAAIRWDDWTVTPGARFEYVRMDARNRLTGVQVEKDFTEALPALSVSRRMSEEWSLFANAQTTFAAPQAAQLSITSNRQDISAQYAWVYEVGSRTRSFDGLFGSELTLYHIDYKDRLEPDPDAFDVFLNSGKSRHRGVEFAVDSEWTSLGMPGLSLWGAAAFNDSEYRNGTFRGNRLPASPEWLLSWGARYRHADSGAFLGVDGFYVDSAFSDRENTRAVNAAGTRGIRPSYAVWNASLGVRRQVAEDTELAFTMGARNVLDEEYFEVRSGRGLFLGAPSSVFAELGVTHRF